MKGSRVVSPARKRNLLRLPIVIFVRIPLLLPFWLLSRLGEYAEKFGDWVGRCIPGFEREH